jgi:hypothetical protein
MQALRIWGPCRRWCAGLQTRLRSRCSTRRTFPTCGAQLLGSLGEALRRDVLVYRARPPIACLEVELEARAVRQELVVATS